MHFLILGATLATAVFAQQWALDDTENKPTIRDEGCFVVVGNKGYLLGGRSPPNTPRPVDEYDIATKTWKTLPWISDGRAFHHPGCLEYKGKIYVAGAYKGRSPSETVVPEMYVYDPSDNTWETRAFLPDNPERRRAACAWTLHDDLMYMSHGTEGGHGVGSTSTAFLDVYDPKTDTWNPDGLKPDAPNLRGHAGGAVVEGKLCVAGGRNDGKADFFNALVPETDCFDLATETWTVEASIPVPRAGGGVELACTGELVVVGGEGNGQAYDDVSYFKPSTGWRTGAKLVEALHGAGVAIGSCDCGFMFVACGAPRQGGGRIMDITQRFTPGGTANSCIPGGTVPPPTESSTKTATESSTFSTMSPSSTVPAPGNVIYNINCGSSEDQVDLVMPLSKSKIYAVSDSVEILDTNEDYLYRSHRSGRRGASFSYVLDVPSSATVSLGFAEIFSRNCEAGDRVFSVSANGVFVKEKLDVFNEVGCEAAYSLSFPVEPDTNGKVMLEFTKDSGAKGGDAFVSNIKVVLNGGIDTSSTAVTSPSAVTSTPTIDSSTFTTAAETTTATTTAMVEETSTGDLNRPLLYSINCGSSEDNVSLVSKLKDSKIYSVSDNVEIANTDDDARYRTHRSGRKGASFEYTLDVPARAEVTLGFAEIFTKNCEEGKRVFTILANGEVVREKLDVFLEVGCNTAYTIAFDVEPNGDSKVVLRFDKDNGATGGDGYVSFIDVRG